MKSKTAMIVVCVSLIALPGVAPHSCIAVERQEIIDTWRALLDESSISFIETVGRNRGSRSDELEESRITWKQSGESRLMIAERLVNGKWSGLVYAANDDYCFELKRESRQHAWTLDELSLESHGSVAESIAFLLDVNGTSTGQCISINSTPGVDFFECPAVVIDSIAAESDDLLRVDFHVDMDKREMALAKRIRCVRGQLELDPSNHMLPVKYELLSRSGSALIGEQRQFEAVDGIKARIPKRGMTSLRDKDGATFTLGYSEVKSVRFNEEIPDGQFRLSAFGIPEPVVTNASQPPLPVWQATVGAILFLVGLLITARSMSKRD